MHIQITVVIMDILGIKGYTCYRLVPSRKIYISKSGMSWDIFYKFLAAIFPKWKNTQHYLQTNLTFIANQSMQALCVLIYEWFNFPA